MNMYDVDRMNKLLVRIRQLTKQNFQLAQKVQQLTADLAAERAQHPVPVIEDAIVIPINLPDPANLQANSFQPSPFVEPVPLIAIKDTQEAVDAQKPTKKKAKKATE